MSGSQDANRGWEASVSWVEAAYLVALAGLTGLLFLLAVAPSAEGKRCRKGVKCEKSLGNGQAGGGAGFQLSLPWAAGQGVFYDDPADARPGAKGLVAGGRCGFFYGQGTHRDNGNRYNDDRFAIDFGVCGKSDKGVPILAAHSGRVIDVDREGEYGNSVVIRSETEDIATRYAHLDKILPGIDRNQEVNKNEQLGTLGKSGDVSDAHLHFAAYTADGSTAVLPKLLGGYVPADAKFYASVSQAAARGALTFEPSLRGRIPADGVLAIYPGQTLPLGFDVVFPSPLAGFDPARHLITPRDPALAQRFLAVPGSTAGERGNDPSVGQFRPLITVPPDQPRGDYLLTWEVTDGVDRLVGDEVLAATVRVLDKPALSVTSGGPGRITARGIDCPGDCTESFPHGTEVTLTASHDATALFEGWTGACSGTALTCTVPMTAAKSVGASFVAKPQLTVQKTGVVASGGTVVGTANTINCGATCTRYMDPNSSITLTASHSAPSSPPSAAFTGWSGAPGCGTQLQCTVNIGINDRTVVAQFNNSSPTITSPPQPRIVDELTAPSGTQPDYLEQSQDFATVVGAARTPYMWSGSDDGVIDGYNVRLIDNGAVIRSDFIDTSCTVSCVSPVNFLYLTNASFTHRYRYAVQAVDTAGLVSAWTETPTFEVRAMGEGGPALTPSLGNGGYFPNLSPTWPADANPRYFGGYFCNGCSAEEDGSVRHTFEAAPNATPDSSKVKVVVDPDAVVDANTRCLLVSYVGGMGPAFGTARIELDNGFLGNVNAFHGNELFRRVLALKTYGPPSFPTGFDCPQLEVIPLNDTKRISFDTSIWFVVVP